MSTASAASGAKSSQARAKQVEVSAPSRREFLYYIWGASMVMLTGELTLGLLWFVFPRFKEGEFGGVFRFDPNDVPNAGSGPFSVPSGRFHVANVEGEGFVALFGVCTHLGCLPKWVPTNNRFECPCHGSKYELNGKWIEGPAPRSLDRFRVTITFEDGSSATTDAEGKPIQIEGRKIASINIDTGSRIQPNGRV